MIYKVNVQGDPQRASRKFNALIDHQIYSQLEKFRLEFLIGMEKRHNEKGQAIRDTRFIVKLHNCYDRLNSRLFDHPTLQSAVFPSQCNSVMLNQ